MSDSQTGSESIGLEGTNWQSIFPLPWSLLPGVATWISLPLQPAFLFQNELCFSLTHCHHCASINTTDNNHSNIFSEYIQLWGWYGGRTGMVETWSQSVFCWQRLGHSQRWWDLSHLLLFPFVYHVFSQPCSYPACWSPTCTSKPSTISPFDNFPWPLLAHN